MEINTKRGFLKFNSDGLAEFIQDDNGNLMVTDYIKETNSYYIAGIDDGIDISGCVDNLIESSQSEVSNGDGFEKLSKSQNDIEIDKRMYDNHPELSKKAPVDYGFKTYTGEELGLKGKDADITVHFKGMPQFNDVKLDYEVVEFSIGTEVYRNVPMFGFQGKIEIRKVKRLSDNEIFSVGDVVNGGTIDEIFILRAKNQLLFSVYGGDRYTNMEISMLNKPLPPKEQVVNEDRVDKQIEEIKKCYESPYYFMTKYYTVNGKKFETTLSEEDFNTWIKLLTKNK